MSIAVCKWAWKVCTYPSAKLVLLCLAEHSDNHGNCWPSLHRIKSMTGLGYTTVTRCLSHLEDNGLVDRKRGKGGKGHSTHYRLAVGNGAKQLRDEIVQQSQEETVSERNSPAVSVKQSHSEQQTVPLRDTNHKEPPLTINKRMREKAHPLFERWYAAYPLKKSRAAASKAFSQLNPDESLVHAMIAAIDRQIREREDKRRRDEFVPQWKHPATWLNGECWLDEPDPGHGSLPPESNYWEGGI